MKTGWSNEYLRKIAKIQEAGGETESTYRTRIQNMLEAASQELAKDRNLTVLHEPERQSGSSPDFCIKASGGTVVGYVECKKPGASLEAALKSDQLKRYGQLSPNILLTDGWRWCRLRDGKLIEDIQLRKPLSAGARTKFHQLLQAFLQHKGAPIATAQKLAEALAGNCARLRDGIENLIDKDQDSLKNLYTELRGQIYRDMKHKEFADAIAQTTVYSLLMARLHATDQELDLYTVTKHIPQTFSLIRHLSKFLQELDTSTYADIRWCVDDILAVINNMNAEEIAATLSVPQKAGVTDDDDPFLYFYETFLAAYDKKNRKIRGVYYTPLPVVRFIIRAVDDILIRDFSLPQGVAGKSVISLDFAAGSGTFMLELMRQAIDKIKGNPKPLIKGQLLPNTHGFEYLIAAYAIAHLKLSYFLKNHGLDIIAESDKKQLQLYLTNTLEKIETYGEGGELFSPLAEETKLANQIKEEQAILVIMGNPPYSGHSQNKAKSMREKIDAYKLVDGQKMTEERTLKWLQDDYVKFIRFAQLKMDQMERGIVAIITNHAFLDNPTFRGMRQSLMQTFNRLYFLDLHGNSKRKEKAPDGGKDENVFDIQQGVAISLLIKNPAVDSGVSHCHLYGKRKDKYEFCSAENMESIPWTPIKPKSPWYLFVPYDNKAEKEYKKFKSLKEIFGESTSGITTSRDHFTIGFTRDEIRERIRHFVKLSPEEARKHYQLGPDGGAWSIGEAQKDLRRDNLNDANLYPIACRPFDVRHTYYTIHSGGFHSRPRDSVMKHMKMENLGLCVSKQQETPGEWQHVFICDTIALLHCATAKEISHIFPLHLHNSEKENIAPAFRKWINDHYGKAPSPEDILGYLYATLHSPDYRRRYADFLRLDFPRIPFTEDIKEFRRRAKIGNKLINAHLLRNVTSKVALHGDNQTIDKIRHDESNRLYINKTSYLSDIPLETYNHAIGGYQPLDKYLKDRKGRELADDDIETIGKAAAAILQTLRQIKSL